MPTNNAIVWVFDSHTEAEVSIKELQSRGFDMKKLSIIGREYHTEEHVVGFYNVGDRVKVWGRFGAFWGGFWGLLFGSAMFVIPGVGPLVVLGPVVGWVVGALEGAVVVGGLSALGAALYGVGIPKDSIVQYETAIKADKFVVVAHGTAAEVANAKAILVATQVEPHAMHELVDEPAPSTLVTSGSSKETN